MQRIPDGEVSPYLTEVLEPGDPVELRGPIGCWFVWRARVGPPRCCWWPAAAASSR